MTGKKLSPSKTILGTAEEFYQAAEHIWSIGQVEYAMPLLVNYAFSAELSIKAMDAYVSGAPPSAGTGVHHPAPISSNVWGHHLDKMFAKLDPATQLRLEKWFHIDTGEDLKQLLAECSSYFEHARYWYEGTVAPRFNLGGVRTLARGLLHAVQQQKP